MNKSRVLSFSAASNIVPIVSSDRPQTSTGRSALWGEPLPRPQSAAFGCEVVCSASSGARTRYSCSLPRCRGCSAASFGTSATWSSWGSCGAGISLLVTTLPRRRFERRARSGSCCSSRNVPRSTDDDRSGVREREPLPPKLGAPQELKGRPSWSPQSIREAGGRVTLRASSCEGGASHRAPGESHGPF